MVKLSSLNGHKAWTNIELQFNNYTTPWLGWKDLASQFSICLDRIRSWSRFCLGASFTTFCGPFSTHSLHAIAIANQWLYFNRFEHPFWVFHAFNAVDLWWRRCVENNKPFVLQINSLCWVLFYLMMQDRATFFLVQQFITPISARKKRYP